MSIIRCPRKPGSPGITPALQDARLTWQARGIFAYLHQQPDQQSTSVNDLVAQGNLGRDGVYAALNNLKAYGYLSRQLQRNDQGQIQQTVWVLYERPEDNPDDTAGAAQEDRS